ncbi:hypothetical protein [Haloferula sargassicola]|uniref:GNAT family N-acetyltransferase n=1 Tax=Haloferula sargassicola TaxID=490096 RepID=A0ABP9UW15_9BACT
MTAMISPPVSCRPASQPETERLRRLFPLGRSRAPTCSVVAVAGSEQALIGHATLVRRERDRDDAFVLLQTRGGEADLTDRLLAEAIVVARACGLTALSTFDSFPEHAEAAAPFLRAGFSAAEWIIEASVRMAEAEARARRVLERFQRRGGIPEGLDFTDLTRRELWPAVRKKVHDERLMDAGRFDDAVAGRGSQPLDRESSAIIADGSELLGIHLASRVPGGLHIPVRWVHENHRHGWLNAALMIMTGDRCGCPPEAPISLGFHTAIHSETARYAHRMGARITSVKQRLRITL